MQAEPMISEPTTTTTTTATAEPAERGVFDAWLRALRDASEDAAPPPATLIVAAHPDDEAVGIGAHLPRLRQAIFAHVTDGAPRNGEDATAHGFASVRDYAAARRREVADALAAAEIDRPILRELGFADQTASLHLVELTQRLVKLLRELRPAVVVTHPYEGGHPDHDATAFAAHAAVALVARGEECAPPAQIIEMSSYHNGPGGIQTGCFLPADGIESVTIALSPAQRTLKRRIFDCFATQRDTLSYFGVEHECFRPAPKYDFAQPPHAGQLFYENYSWGMSGQQFRMLARQAQHALGLRGPT